MSPARVNALYLKVSAWSGDIYVYTQRGSTSSKLRFGLVKVKVHIRVMDSDFTFYVFWLKCVRRVEAVAIHVQLLICKTLQRLPDVKS